MKYSIYHGGRVIEPPSHIQNIFHGSKLIWARTEKTLFDTRLRGHLFTKNGILSPAYITGGDSVDFYDITGKKAFSYDYNGIIDYGEKARFVWSNSPSYNIQYIPDGLITPRLKADYIENDTRIIPCPIPDDSAANWRSYSDNVKNYVKNKPLTIGSNGADIYPASRPFAYIDGKIRPISYIHNGNIVTDLDYVILSICGNRMVCADSVSINNYGSIYGNITVRNVLTGDVIASPFSSRQLIMTLNASSEYPKRYSLAGDYILYRTQQNGKTVLRAMHTTEGTVQSVSSGIPENIVYDGSKYMCIGEDISYGADIGSLYDHIYLNDSALGHYTVCNYDTPGAYYQSDDGSIYVIGQSVEKDENGNANYKIFRIQDFLEA